MILTIDSEPFLDTVILQSYTWHATKNYYTMQFKNFATSYFLARRYFDAKFLIYIISFLKLETHFTNNGYIWPTIWMFVDVFLKWCKGYKVYGCSTSIFSTGTMHSWYPVFVQFPCFCPPGLGLSTVILPIYLTKMFSHTLLQQIYSSF